MDIKFCDRCKKNIDNIPLRSLFTLRIVKTNSDISEMRKTFCEECANDIMNLIDYECDRYRLDSVVVVSKEATSNEEKMS